MLFSNQAGNILDARNPLVGFHDDGHDRLSAPHAADSLNVMTSPRAIVKFGLATSQARIP